MDCSNARYPIERFTGNPIVAWVIRHQELSGLLLLLLFMIVIAIDRWMQFSGNVAPPGSDGGQWLAFGHQLFNGDQVRAGSQFYPPVFPFLVRMIAQGDGLLTLKLLGISASVLTCIPMYLIFRTALHPWISAALAATVAFTPYHSEVLCFGGYPQLLGTAFLVLSVFLVLQGMNTGQKKWFLLASLATAITVGSNVLPATILVGSTAVIFSIWIYRLWNSDRTALHARFRLALIFWIFPSIILCLPFVSIYWDYLFSTEQSVVNQRDLPISDLLNWLGGSWRTEFLLWLSVLIVATVFFFMGTKRVLSILNSRSLLVDGTLALLIPGFVGFLLFRELRFISFIEIGLVLLTGLLLHLYVSTPSRFAIDRSKLAATLTIVLVVVIVIGGVGYRRFRIAHDWYTVVDANVMPAMQWMRENRIPEVRVAATAADRGHNHGWWIEGYAHMPTYMAGDPDVFILPEEHDQIAIAHRLLMEDIPPDVIRYLADTENIEFLFLDMRVLPHPPDDFLDAGFVQVFGNGTIVIMQKEPL
ncbi:MAG: hypothetical protein HQ553_07885 [Chloroflexi bacterium]|nr:hypothetical protein [Chloroflexota bacterium]